MEQTHYYVVRTDLSIVSCYNWEHCISTDDFLYAIIENNRPPYVGLSMLDINNSPFSLAANGWKMVVLKMASLNGGRYATLPVMEIADPQGLIQQIAPRRGHYRGIIDLHKLFIYLAWSPDWHTANKRRRKMELKNLFVTLKNGHPVRYSLPVNPDADYEITLSYKKGIYTMKSCILEWGDNVYEEVSNEDEYHNEDFDIFIDTVTEKFPALSADIFGEFNL